MTIRSACDVGSRAKSKRLCFCRSNTEKADSPSRNVQVGVTWCVSWHASSANRHVKELTIQFFILDPLQGIWLSSVCNPPLWSVQLPVILSEVGLSTSTSSVSRHPAGTDTSLQTSGSRGLRTLSQVRWPWISTDCGQEVQGTDRGDPRRFKSAGRQR